MPIISIVGPKGGIGKTTLSINTTAALTQLLGKKTPKKQICLVDLDLRLPTITSLLDCHPRKTFYNLFETLANKTYQIDFLRNLYQIVTWFNAYLEGEIQGRNKKLQKAFVLFKTLKTELFQHMEYKEGLAAYELFLSRGNIHSIPEIKKLKPLLKNIDLPALRKILKQAEHNSRPMVQEYINFIEEYDFSIIGGEVPVLGKRGHRKRINEPEYLLLFLEFLNSVFDRFRYVVLDTPAGGINHLSSLMNVIDQVIFVFDLSNNIAINGSIDALHSFIDYYEEFLADFQTGKLTGLDKNYVTQLTAQKGHNAIVQSLKNKKLGIIFNRGQNPSEIPNALNMLKDYLETLDKYQQLKKRIHILSSLPNHKVINITNNHGTLFYKMDPGLSGCMDMVARAILSDYKTCPTLESGEKTIMEYLTAAKKPPLMGKISQIATNFS